MTQQASKFRHSLALQTRFNDFDMFGHLNNTVYYEFYDLGKSAYIEAALGDAFDPRKMVLALVNSNCDFLAQTLPGDELDVLTAVTRISEHAIHLRQRVVERNTGEVKSKCTAVMVSIDTAAVAAAPVPDEWRHRIAEYEGRDFSLADE